MSAIESEGLVSPSDIAEMAGVTRGAVSNWRRRIKGFPEPVAGTEAKPLFSRRAIRNWLAHRGVETSHDTGEAAVWAVMNALRDHLEAGDATELILSLCAARKASHEDQPALWKRLIRSAETDTQVALAEVDRALEFGEIVVESRLQSDWRLTRIPPLALSQVMSVIGEVEVDNLASIADFALDRLEKSQMRVAGEHGLIGSRVSILLASLASEMSGGILYDPACGLAVALIAAVEEEAARPHRIVGHDVSISAVRRAGLRAFLHGVPIDLATTDILISDAEPELRADVILAEPPFGVRAGDRVALEDARFAFGPIPRNSSEMLWIQHVVNHLSETGRGYVVTPQGPLFRSGAEAKIRGELLLRGCIEAIVSLPGKMLPYSSIPLALWVLRPVHSEKVRDTVLLIDATQVDAAEERVRDWLRADVLPAEVVNARVSISEFLAANTELLPSRWVEHRAPAGETISAALRHAEGSLNGAIAALERASTDFGLSIELPPARVSSVQELAELGVLSIQSGKKFDSDDPIFGRRVVGVTQVNNGDLPKGEGPVPSDIAGWLTQSNDVLVTTMNRVQTFVEREGGHLPQPGIYRLRINRQDTLLPDYLAAVLKGSWNKRFISGAGIQRASLRDLEVPLVPLDAQRRIAKVVADANAIRNAAMDVSGSSTASIEALLEAVRYQESGD